MLEIEPMLCDLWSQTQRAELWKTSGELVNLGIDKQPQMSPCKGNNILSGLFGARGHRPRLQLSKHVHNRRCGP